MLALSAWRLARGLGAKTAQAGRERDFDALGTDSRRIAAGACFVALAGKRSGESFFGDALKRGAGALVGRHFSAAVRAQARRQGAWLLRVPQGLAALQALAAEQRGFFRGPVLALTGSNGKTGTKDLLAHLLSVRGPVLATQGNLNNHIGLPLTILGAGPGHWAWVLEAGMNHKGELRSLAKIAKPDLVLELNVGDAHLGHFKDRSAIAEAKAELLEGLGPTGLALLNADDPFCAAMGRRHKGPRLSFGLAKGADLRVRVSRDRGAGGFSGWAQWSGALGTRPWRQALFGPRGGKAALSQTAAALCAGAALGLAPKGLAKGLASYKPKAAMRQELKPLPKGAKALLDAYNASPQSMSAALDYLALSAPKAPRWAVLGCMLELGSQAARLHRALGAEARRSGLKGLVALGAHARDIAAGFGPGALALEADEVLSAAAWVRERLQPGAWFLFKGSRGLAVERVYHSLQGA